MASKSRLTHQATLLLLLLITWRESMHCNGLTVDPPEDLVISDPGHLGHLEITWSPPASLINVTECQKQYQLEYFNTYKNRWTLHINHCSGPQCVMLYTTTYWSAVVSATQISQNQVVLCSQYFANLCNHLQTIRTSRMTHSAQFDLMKDITVRVYTLLSGPCTNGTMMKSTSYTELVRKPLSTGVVGTAVQDFVCVYHNMMYVECNWGRSPKMPANSQQNLYFWHKELEQAEECPKYLFSSGTRSGCNFTEKSLPEFTNINFCINGSSSEGPLKPTFISLQIQNQGTHVVDLWSNTALTCKLSGGDVKPDTTEKVHLQTGPDMQLELHWDGPAGRIPGHCVEWEVEHNQEEPDGKITSQQITTKQTSLTLPPINDNQRNCFRVRSRLHKYCAEKSFWSEWSRPTCHPEKEEVPPEPEWDMVPIYVYIAVAIIAILVLSLCVGAVLKVRRSRQVKKPDSLLTTLFTRNSVLTVTDV